MWVDVDGGRLELHTTGSGSPLLLLHGWTLDHRIFRLQVPYLARSLRVTTFDRRGFGRSEAPPDLHRELDDIDTILRTLGIETVHLLGMSQGARLALRFAVSRPGSIRSLILQAPVIDGLALDEDERERIPMEEFASLARAGRMDEVRRRWLAHPIMALGPDADRLRRDLEEIINDYQGKDLLRYTPYVQAFPHDVLGELSGFDRPCLILTGRHDTATRREHARRLRETLPFAREIVFAASGHLSNLVEADAYNRQVSSFCASVDA